MDIIVGLSVIGGVVLIVATIFDIVATVLHPQAQSPISNRFHRLGWRLLGGVARRLPAPERRHIVLGWGLPLLISGLIGLWVLALVVGFALLYYPWIGDPAHFDTPPGTTGSPLDAFYFSGTSLTTVGFGDFQALSVPFRLLAIAEAASGFVVISLSVAYLLAVYPAVGRVQALSAALDAEVAGQPGALPLVRRYLAAGERWDDAFADRLRELAVALLEVTGGHETHPVLYYSHPHLPHLSFLRVLLTVQGIVGRCRYGLSPDKHGAIVRNPQLVLLEQSLLYALRRLSASLHIPAIRREDALPEDDQLRADYERICAELDGLGLTSARQLASAPVAPILDSSVDDPARDADGDGEDAGHRAGARAVGGREAHGVGDPAYDDTATSPVAAYRAFRCETDPHLVAYAVACGYSIDEARRDREVG